MNDSRAIDAVLNGDRSQYELLIDRYKKTVYGIAWSQLGNAELSEDAAQETFVRAYTYLRTLRDPGRFPFWLARIARNVCRGFRLTDYRRSKVEAQWHWELTSRSERSPDANAALWEAFGKLAAVHREALTVYYIDGNNCAESAASLGITEAAMKVRLHRARTALRMQIEDAIVDDIAKLKPSPRFTSNVMSILPISPVGLWGYGSAAVGVGKLAAASTFVLWLAWGSVGAVGILTWLQLRQEVRELQDIPENAFRKKQLARRYQVTLFSLLAGLAMSAIIYCVFRFGGHREGIGVHGVTVAMMRILFCVLLPFTIVPLRLLRVNKSAFAVGNAALSLMFALFYGVVGFTGVAMASVWPYVWVGICLGGTFISAKMPRRTDYNLFLRAETGGLGLRNVSTTSRPTMAISDRVLVDFARFLGEQWLVRDYKLSSEGIVLAPGHLSGRVNVFWSLFRGSQIAIDRGGRCSAMLSSADRKAIERLIGREIDPSEAETAVGQSIETALGAYLAGDRVEANRLLTAQTEDEIYRNGKPNRMWQQAATCIAIALLILSHFVVKHHNTAPQQHRTIWFQKAR